MTEEREELKLSGLVAKLLAEFEDVASRRRVYEQRWIRDLRQYKGVYDPEILSKIPSNKSKAFIRLTKVKVETLVARLMDLLFPANGEKNWDIKPSPEPQVHPQLIEVVIGQLMQQGGDISQIDKEKLLRELAQQACDNMKKVIEDQLAEDEYSMSYFEVAKQVILSAVKSGTGILKGVLTDTRQDKRFIVDETGNFRLVFMNPEPRPYYEFVPIWNIYPDMNVTDIRYANFVWQTHVFSKKELLDLAKRQDFDAQAIYEYLQTVPNGDYNLLSYEADLYSICDSEEEVQLPDMKGKYRVYERWGYLDGRELEEAGIEIKEDIVDRVVYSTNVWILGNKIIKAVLNPIEGVDIPYFFYYYFKDETSIWGESLPSVMRHPQRVFNSAVRALLDNASITTGPQIGINVRKLVGDEDPSDVYPFKVWLFDNVDDIRKVFSLLYMPSYTVELMNIVKFFYDFLDEVSTPRFMHGDEKISGAGKTASGLSMLMAAANINIKDLVKEFDSRITKPFITAMYMWNMKFNPRIDIKGDYQVVATGTSSLVAREVQAQRILNAINITNNPRFQGRVNDDKLLDEVLKVLELPEHLKRSEEEYRQWQEQQLAMQAMAEKEAEIQAILKEAEKRGIDPQQMFKELLGGILLQQQQQAQPQPQIQQPQVIEGAM